MTEDKLNSYRSEIDKINIKILDLLSERGKLINKVGDLKRKKNIELFSPKRESEMLKKLVSHNQGPYSNIIVKKIFREIFRASIEFMGSISKTSLKISRHYKSDKTIIKIKDEEIGSKKPLIIAGPCAVESEESLYKIATFLKENGIKFLRGGAFKPRTSPYSFQGLGIEGIRILRKVANKLDMLVVTEITGIRYLDEIVKSADIIQIGTRNMSNFDLLKSLSSIEKPILFKRGFMSTIQEYLLAAEYLLAEGNNNVILCERGIRTFEKWTRNTLDISAIPLINKECHLPLIVDLSHSVGRTDILLPLAKASLAAGADGLMIEVHNDPDHALSDNEQQLNFEDFSKIIKEIIPTGK